MLPEKPVQEANTKRCTSPNDPVYGKDIKGYQQAAMNARDLTGRNPVPMPYEEMERNYRAIDIDNRRKLRGGSTYHAGEGIEP